MGWDAGGSRALGNITFTPGGGIQGLVPGTVNFDVRVRDEYNRDTHTASVAVTITGAEPTRLRSLQTTEISQVTEGESMSFNLDGFFSDDGGDANLSYAFASTPQGVMAPTASISGSDLTINASSNADTGEYDLLGPGDRRPGLVRYFDGLDDHGGLRKSEAARPGQTGNRCLPEWRCDRMTA